jgi:magnesium chelatase subunit ChlI-like protein
MLAARLPSILPPLAPAEPLEVSMVASVAGIIEGGALTNRRPFRAPHHSASMPALVGGGLHARPGEISLAHHGVLFLDELPEFQPQALDSLRQPLETGEVSIARANHRVTYPARFMLVAAMNPCRCGKANEPGFTCRRGPNTRCAAEYQTRLSGPLLDRIDLHIEVPSVTAADLILPPPTEGSREVAERVALARERQAARYAAIGRPQVRTNAAVASASWKTWRGRTAAGLLCYAKPPTRCGFRPAAIIACCALRARSPILTAPRKSAACIWPRPCPIARSPTTSGARLKGPVEPIKRGRPGARAVSPLSRFTQSRCRGPSRACRSRIKIPDGSRRDRGIRRACGLSPC